MCGGCYEEYGEPKIVNERTKAAAALIDKVYDWSCVGGNCHTVIDDWNIEDEHIRRELEYVAKGGWAAEFGGPDAEPESPEQLADERACLEALQVLTLEERASAMAIHEGWLTV